MYWQRVHHADPRALDISDRHYSRKSIGTPEFVEPGNKIVLMHFCENSIPAALWAWQRPAPGSGIGRADGRDVWNCSLFRVEHKTVLASELIKEAVAIAVGIWTPLPSDGCYTTINPKFVKSQGRKRGYGWCYQCAGWQVLPERTKARNLVQLLLPPEDVRQIAPIAASWSVPTFGMAWRRWPRATNDGQARMF
jgi:hypothetical protein